MFRRFSRASILLQLIAIILVALVLFLPAILNPPSSIDVRDTNPLYIFIITLIGESSLVTVFLAIGIIGFLAFFLYSILVSHSLHSKESLLPVLFYFLLTVGLTNALRFGPALIATLFLLISLFLILRIYGSNQPYKQVFSASFSVSIAGLFYPPAISFMIFIWLSFLTYRIASWREWVISIIGVLIPLVYLVAYFYWIGMLPDKFHNYSHFFSTFITEFPKFRLWQEIFLGFTGLTILLTLFRQILLIQDKLISIRRKTWVFIDFIIVASFSSLLSGTDLIGHFAIIAIPGALFLSNSVTGKKASIPFELFSAIFIILLIFARMSA